MPKYRHNKHDEFYTEIPRTEADPFKDLGTDIEDDHESVDYERTLGLSDEQVSQIAKDSLEQQHSIQYAQRIRNKNFDPQSDTSQQRY